MLRNLARVFLRDLYEVCQSGSVGSNKERMSVSKGKEGKNESVVVWVLGLNFNAPPFKN